ncbi:heavy-metal-associated domain-containing protein [Bacteroidota bacterium]
MKTIIKLSLVALIAIYTTSAFSQKTNKDTLVINTSAQCEMCKERIEKNLVYETGIIDANLDLETKQVFVIYKTNKISDSEIKQVISKIGYDADDVKADEKAYNKLPLCCQKNSGVKHEDM